MAEKYIMDEAFDYFYNDEGVGPPIESPPVSKEILAKFEGKLPNQLLEYWKAFGFSGWGNGLFWLVNPDDYQEGLDAWLEHVELPSHEEYFVIARTAFGDLEIWGTIHGHCLTISSIFSRIYPQMEIAKNERWDSLLRTFLIVQEKGNLDLGDWKNKPLFD
ncbi:GAD-like domain-containing protein, partial [Acinetobacter courvalinii]